MTKDVLYIHNQMLDFLKKKMIEGKIQYGILGSDGEELMIEIRYDPKDSKQTSVINDIYQDIGTFNETTDRKNSDRIFKRTRKDTDNGIRAVMLIDTKDIEQFSRFVNMYDISHALQGAEMDSDSLVTRIVVEVRCDRMIKRKEMERFVQLSFNSKFKEKWT